MLSLTRLRFNSPFALAGGHHQGAKQAHNLPALPGQGRGPAHPLQQRSVCRLQGVQKVVALHDAKAFFGGQVGQRPWLD